jgi:hypothetical protein
MMASDRKTRKALRSPLIVWIGLTVITLFTQYRSGAYVADFARDSDEPAHAVSSLMVRDYLAQAFPGNPLRFAHSFYDHYPKVAIGHWPPMFYCLEGGWMLLFGRTRIAMLVFVALCAVTLVGAVYFKMQRMTSAPVACFSAAVLMCSPIFQSLACSVRPDLLLALLVFWATIYMTEYMVTKKRGRLMLCLALSVMAALVHYRAAVLLLMPFSVLFLERRRITWKWMLAAAALTFVILWIHLAIPENHMSLASFGDLLHSDISRTALNLEWLPLIPAAVAIFHVTRDRTTQPFWTAMTGLAITSFCFNLVIPSSWYGDHLVVVALPAWAALAGYGMQLLFSKLDRSGVARSRTLQRGLMAVALSAIVVMSFLVRRKNDPGFHRLVASGYLANIDSALIAANSLNEGSLIAESSLVDPFRTHTIFRGSKLLAQSTWGGNRYRMRFSSTPELRALLDAAHVCLTMVQTVEPLTPDQRQLRSLLEHDPDWTLVSSGPQIKGIEIYRRSSASEAHCR